MELVKEREEVVGQAGEGKEGNISFIGGARGRKIIRVRAIQ